MSLIIHNKYKYFDSTVQGAEDRRQKFHFCRLPFAVNVMLNLSIIYLEPVEEYSVGKIHMSEPESGKGNVNTVEFVNQASRTSQSHGRVCLR